MNIMRLCLKFLDYILGLDYDVDGRGDISWSNTFSKRLKVKLEQLLEYEKSIQAILKISKDKELSKQN